MARRKSARIDKLRERRERILGELRSLNREIGRMERMLGLSRSRSTLPARKPNARRLNELTVKDAIVKVLRKRKRPMHYKDITETLLEQGIYRTKSKNFLSTVAISIMRDKRLERVEPGVYRLRRGA